MEQLITKLKSQVPAAAGTVSSATRLFEQVSRTARKATRLYHLRAAAIYLTVFLVYTLFWICLDYRLHIEERGLRWLVFIAWIGGATFAAVTRFWPALQFRVSGDLLAKQVEAAYGDEARGLADAVVLAGLQSDASGRYGSAQFRGMALRRAEALVDRLDWESCIRWQPTRRALSIAGLTLAGVAVICLLCPQQASPGFMRLALPWADVAWPRHDDLQWVNLPRALPIGESLAIEVEDRLPPLPNSVVLHLRRLDDADGSHAKNDSLNELRLPMQVAGGRAVIELPPAESSFEVRVSGGDDDRMAWQKIDVLRPPVITHSKFLIAPPPYTHIPAGELVGRSISVLAGSSVGMDVEFSEPVLSVEPITVNSAKPKNVTAMRESGSVDALHNEMNAREDKSSAVAPKETIVPWISSVEKNGSRVHLRGNDDRPPVIDQSWQWKLRIKTTSGLEFIDPTLWTIEVHPDAPPEITSLEIEPAELSSGMQAMIRGQATDDIELAQIRLLWKPSNEKEDSPERVRALWNREVSEGRLDNLTADSQAAQEAALKTAAVNRQVTVSSTLGSESDWNVLEGAMISVWLEVEDSKGQTTRSSRQTIQIVSQQTVLQQLQAQQVKMAEALQQIMDAQNRNRTALDRLQNVLAETGQVTREQMESLSAAAELQQSLSQQLSAQSGGLSAQVEQLRRRMQDAGLGASAPAEQLNAIAAELNDQVRPTADQAITDLSSAIDNLESKLGTDESASVGDLRSNERLKAAAEGEKKLTDALQSLASKFDQSRSTQAVLNEGNNLLQRQAQLEQATEQFQRDRLSNQNSDAREASRIGLRSDQQGLAREVDELAGRLAKMLEKREGSESSDSNRMTQDLRSALQVLGEEQPGQRMREAAEKIHQNEPVEALSDQQAASQSLQRALSQLDGRAVSQADRPTDPGQLAEALARLIAMQSPMVDRLEKVDVASLKDPAQAESIRQWTREEDAVRAQTESLRKSLPESSEFRWVLDGAHQDMARTVAAMERGRIKPEAHASSADALHKLVAARDALEAVRAEMKDAENSAESGSEEQPSGEQPEPNGPSAAQLMMIRSLQLQINQETERLQQQLALNQEDREAQARLRLLAQQQSELADELKRTLSKATTRSEPPADDSGKEVRP